MKYYVYKLRTSHHMKITYLICIQISDEPNAFNIDTNPVTHHRLPGNIIQECNISVVEWPLVFTKQSK